MECFLSTSCFKKFSVREAVEKCRELGVNNIELSALHPSEPFSSLLSQLVSFKESGIQFTVHNYFPSPPNSFVLNIASQDEAIRIQSEQLIRNALTIAQSIEAPFYGIHAGYLASATPGEKGLFNFTGEKLPYLAAMQHAASFVLKINDFFESSGVTLILENLFPTAQGQYSLFSTFEEIKDLVKQLPESIGLLLDLGHLNIASNILGFDKYDFLDKYLAEFGPRLLEIHLSENQGRLDEHLPLMAGSWQLEILDEIKSVPVYNNKKRLYCLESREATPMDLKKSLEFINKRISI